MMVVVRIIFVSNGNCFLRIRDSGLIYLKMANDKLYGDSNSMIYKKGIFMKKQIKKLILVASTCLAMAAPVFANTSTFSNAMSAGGAVVTSPTTKKTTPTGVPALVNFTQLTNYDNQKRALAVRVRNINLSEASNVGSVLGTGTVTLTYLSGQGIYGTDYVCRIATHTQSTGGASFTCTFTP